MKFPACLKPAEFLVHGEIELLVLDKSPMVVNGEADYNFWIFRMRQEQEK
jgi:hypothetical protein